MDYVCCLYLISGEDAVSTSGMIIPDYEISYAPLSLERAVEIFLMFNYSNPQYYFINGGYAYIEPSSILFTDILSGVSEWKQAQSGNTGNEKYDYFMGKYHCIGRKYRAEGESSP